jgi:hypothetical protein
LTQSLKIFQDAKNKAKEHISRLGKELENRTKFLNIPPLNIEVGSNVELIKNLKGK